MRIVLPLFLLLSLATLSAQSIVSVTLQEEFSEAELDASLPVDASYGLRTYKVVYQSTGLDGQPVNLSGMLSVPFLPGSDLILPTIVYMHGTAGNREAVPSRVTTGERVLINVLATNGYITLAPDYLGLGDDQSTLHPYVHSETEARSGRDMLIAVREWLSAEGIGFNDQLYVTGYSQGGHASMALHRDLQENPGEDGLTVTAAAHLSGPYSISGVMGDIVTSGDGQTFPGYLAYTYVSYNLVYDIYDSPAAVFQEPYLAPIDSFSRGELELEDVNQRLFSLLQRDSADLQSMFRDSIINILETQPDHPLNQALRDNDTYDWAPEVTTLLVYCTNDEQVPFQNAILADSVMRANGSELVLAFSGGPNSHFDCINPAIIFTLTVFGSSAQIVTDVQDPGTVENLAVFPNPLAAGQPIRLAEAFEQDLTFELFTTKGQRLIGGVLPAGQRQIELDHFTPGLYTLRLMAERSTYLTRIIIQ